ncbi:MAG: MBL fold metallo-hydrolase [Myxococcota bacterium]
MNIHPFYDPATYTLTYVVFDPETRDAVVIDPVLDFDPLRVAVETRSNDAVVRFIREQGLTVHYMLETHAHADHLSGSQGLKHEIGGKVAIGEQITAVQEVFKGVFHLPDSFATDGSQFDHLIEDGEVLEAGALTIKALHTPGHTPACMSYLIDDAVFTGDALFMPDFGTGRCDFPRGSAEDLYDSIQKLYALPDETRVFVGHDYQPGGRALAFETTIGASRDHNVQLRGDTGREDFIAFRTARDEKLRPPRLIFQSVQVNINAGAIPTTDENGRKYLTLPIGVI